jgi:hypothetical protein
MIRVWPSARAEIVPAHLIAGAGRQGIGVNGDLHRPLRYGSLQHAFAAIVNGFVTAIVITLIADKEPVGLHEIHDLLQIGPLKNSVPACPVNHDRRRDENFGRVTRFRKRFLSANTIAVVGIAPNVKFGRHDGELCRSCPRGIERLGRGEFRPRSRPGATRETLPSFSINCHCNAPFKKWK